MRKITKGPEPKEWTKYRQPPNVQYQANNALRSALLKEQGYICAYCMRRIPTRDQNSTEKSRIDHILSRSNHPELQLSYNNMVICCPGAITNDFHCDKRKGENDITFDILSDYFVSTLSYSTKDGEISSSNPQYNDQINNILNLNNPLLKKNRLLVLRGVIKTISQNVSKTWTPTLLQRLYTLWNEKDSQGSYQPYHGIVLWYLARKIHQTRH